LADNFPETGAYRYHAAVFGVAGRRAVEILVGLFAVLGFVYVPLGEKTALQHLVAIGSTSAVRDAAGEIWAAGGGLRSRVARALGNTVAPPPRPVSSSGPRAEVPDLGQ
jgi:hypothetical protein